VLVYVVVGVVTVVTMRLHAETAESHADPVIAAGYA
jgi:hypothetical protein